MTNRPIFVIPVIAFDIILVYAIMSRITIDLIENIGIGSSKR